MKTNTQMASETQEAARTSFWGHELVLVAHGGRPFCGGRALVALKIAKEVESMARMIKLQLKLTPRRATLANRTLVLTFCWTVSGSFMSGG
jgi:hypothetical protein